MIYYIVFFAGGIHDDGKRKVSVYLKDNGVIEDTFYFWTQSQVNKILKLLEFLKQLK